MIWKCQVTIVMGEGEDGEVTSLERYSNDPVVGLGIVFQECIQRLSCLDYKGRSSKGGMQLLGWADAILDPDRGSDALRSQRLMDRARSVELRPEISGNTQDQTN